MRPYRSRIALLETDALRWTRSASLYFATRLAVLQRTHRPCVPTGVVLLCWRRMPFAGHYPCIPIFRYSSCCTTTYAQTVRPYRSRIALLETGTLWLDMSRAPLQRATGLIRRLVRFAERIFHSKMQFGVEVSVLACASKKKATFATSSAFKYR